MVAVQDFAFFIDEETAVSVAVVGNAAVSAFFYYFFLQGFDMGGAAAVIDVYAVGLIEMGITSAPSSARIPGRKLLAAPLAESVTIFMPLKSPSTVDFT